MIIGQGMFILAIGITIRVIIRGIGGTIAGETVAGKVSAGERLIRCRG